MKWHYLNSNLDPGSFLEDKIGYYYGTNHNIDSPLDLSDINSKIASFDLDHTVITTKNGNTFAKDSNDWKWFNSNVPDVLYNLFKKGYRIMIITNQGGIKQNEDKLKVFQEKLDLIEYNIIKKYSKIKFEVFCLNNKDVFRKPFPTVITSLFDNISPNSFYCGDAAGREKDFSDSDIKFAYNSRLKFCTPEQLFLKDSSNSGILTINNLIDNEIHGDYKYTPLNNLPELIIMVGFPGSGKSYIAEQIQINSLLCHDTYKDFVESNKIVILSLDNLKTRAKLEKQIKDAILNNYTIIVDNTSLSKSDRSKLINILNSEKVRSKYVVRVLLLNKNIYDSHHMNCYRYYLNYKTNPKFVPEHVYKMMRARYEDPSTESEDIDVIERIDPGHPIDMAYYFYYK